MYLLPFMHKRIYFVDEKMFAEILRKKEINHNDINDEELKLQLKKDTPGSIVVMNVQTLQKTKSALTLGKTANMKLIQIENFQKAYAFIY